MGIRQIFIGLTTEGSTDVRFLKSIVERTFIDVAFECDCDIEPLVGVLEVDKHDMSFVDYVVKASRQGVDEMGMTVLCIHADADAPDNTAVYSNKIAPANAALGQCDEDTHCRIMVPAVPVQMIEAWMLADKQLLKDVIGTSLSDEELGINRAPESIANPKTAISNAIRIDSQSKTKRRRRDFTIANLYDYIGERIELAQLDKLPSYQCFKNEVRNAYRCLNLMH